jgi:transposase InsO family protein
MPVGRRNRARMGATIAHPSRMIDVLALLLGVLSSAVRTRRNLVAENLLLRHQLAVLTRPTRRRSRPARRDKLLWVLASRVVPGWRRHLVLVTPDTVVRWHRRGWRLVWHWRSRSRGGGGRASPPRRATSSGRCRATAACGVASASAGEVLKLGIAVSNRSVRRYRWRGTDRPPSQSRRTVLANHRPRVWAADLLTVQTLTFRTLSVLVLVAHGRRELVHFAVTAHPTAAWVWRQLINATPWGRTPAYLVRDRDAVYGADSVRKAAGLGIRALLAPVRAPRANAIAERLVGTLRRECLDHAIVVNERHLEVLLSDFARYYNVDRPHRTLALETPQVAARPHVGPVRARPVLGGLHHAYERAA